MVVLNSECMHNHYKDTPGLCVPCNIIHIDTCNALCQMVGSCIHNTSSTSVVCSGIGFVCLLFRSFVAVRRTLILSMCTCACVVVIIITVPDLLHHHWIESYTSLYYNYMFYGSMYIYVLLSVMAYDTHFCLPAVLFVRNRFYVGFVIALPLYGNRLRLHANTDLW